MGERELDDASPRHEIATACRICAAGCGVIVTVDESGPIAVKGDPDDPWSKGFTCSKGRAAIEFHRRVDRLDRPMIRRDGALVAVSWDEALDDLADRLRAVITEHGAGTIADYVGTGGPLDPSGYTLATGFFRALGTEQRYSALSVDCSGKYLVSELVAGVQLPFQPDLDHADLLLAVGVNTVVSHGHGIMVADPLVRLRALRARGGRLVVVDPRRSETAQHADLHLAVRPATDPALLAHTVRELLAAGRDDDYLAACADRASLDRLRDAVAPFDAARTAAICGVDEAELERFVAMVRSAGRIAIETGVGTTMNLSSNLTEWLVWALSAVTGSLDRRGGATFNPGFLRPLEDGLPGGRGDLAPGPASRPELPRIVNGEMPCAAMADEIESGHVRALIVRGGNPIAAFPDMERLRRVASDLDVLVAIDVRSNETTDIATHVLPMADHLERSELVTGYLQAEPFVRFAPAAVQPVGERRPQWWIFAELSRRLGLPLFASARRDAALRDTVLDDEKVAALLLERARHPFAAVRAEPYGLKDASITPGWLIPGRLPRLLDLAPAELAGDLAAFAASARSAAAAPVDGALVLVGRRTAGRYNSLPLRAASETLWINPIDAARVGVEDGQVVRVSTETGAIEVVAEVTEAIRPGTVSVPHGLTFANLNQLTSDRMVEPRNAMPVLSGFPVRISVPSAASG